MTRKNSKQHRKQVQNVAKFASATALITPLVLTGPAVIDVTAQTRFFEDWLVQQIGDSLEVGDSVTLDLAEFFGDLNNARLMIINHNHQVAVVSIIDGLMTLDGRKVGSTTVDLLIEHSTAGPSSERFRLIVQPAAGLEDLNADGIGIDDIVRYIHTHSHKTFRRENLIYLLEHISTVIQAHNRPPEATDEPFHLRIPSGESKVIDLRDFFFDPDGDQLEYIVEHDTEIVEFMLDDYLLSLTATGVFGTETELIITARDGQTESDIRKNLILTVVAGDEYSPPVLVTPIPDQTITEGLPFSYVVPHDTFSDAGEYESLTYTASLENGEPLPSWLTFDSHTRTFSGVPMQEGVEHVVGTLVLQVTATNSSGASASTTFQLTIVEASDAPIALYDDIGISLYQGQQLDLDMTALFTTMDNEELDIFSVDGRDHWTADGLLVDFISDSGMFYVMMSGSIVEPSSLHVEFQAEGKEQSLSDIVSVTVTLEPEELEALTVNAGSQLSLSELFEGRFLPYTLDGYFGEFNYSISDVDWADIDEDHPDLIYIHPQVEGTRSLIVSAHGLNGAILINHWVTFEIVADGDG